MNVTPIARIEFDRAFMEKVLAEAKVAEESKDSDTPRVAISSVLIISWLLVNLACIGLTAFLTNFKWSAIIPAYFYNTWALLIFLKPPEEYLDAPGCALVSAFFFGGILVSTVLLPAAKVFTLRIR